MAWTPIAERTDGFQKFDGFYPLYWDEASGTLYLEIPKLNQEVLYVSGLSAGLGSNDIGLDRAQIGGQKLVRFERVGTKVLMVQPNYSYRAVSNNASERKAVEDAFAKSILWGFTAIAETSGRVLVDLTDFIMRDTHGVVGNLGAGYRFDRTRSAVYVPNTKAFPKNTEIDVTLTFANDAAGGRGGGGGPAQGPEQIGGRAGAGGGGGRGGGLFSGSVASVTPSPDSVTMREHISLVELPDNNFKPRWDDPRAGYGGLTYVDYSVPIGEPMQMRYIRRHRLEKKDPGAAISEAVKPIQYWVDSGAPETLLDFIRWGIQTAPAKRYALVLWSPLMAVGIYFGLGAIVLASRLIFPRPKAANAPVTAGQSDNDDRELSIAA